MSNIFQKQSVFYLLKCTKIICLAINIIMAKNIFVHETSVMINKLLEDVSKNNAIERL